MESLILKTSLPWFSVVNSIISLNCKFSCDLNDLEREQSKTANNDLGVCLQSYDLVGRYL